LYSRRPKSILSHLKQIFKKGANDFIGTWYSGYGHNSIGDCGSMTLYFENVSMLAAKAIQNWPLYNGQEASTRYLDFAGRTMINPMAGWPAANYLYIPKEDLKEESLVNIDNCFKNGYENSVGLSNNGFVGKEIQDKWMAYYEKHMPIVKEYVSFLNEKDSEMDQETYDKAVSARAFDIMRAFIPAGMTTLVSWHNNIRQVRDHLAILKYHPSFEITRIATTALQALKTSHPASFDKQKVREETEEYLKLRANETSYFGGVNCEEFMINDNRLDIDMIHQYAHLLKNRPPKNEAPHEIGEAGTVNVLFNIDFGSFRDAQRHRKGVCKMPLLTTELGFHTWYLDRLPEQSKTEALALITELQPLINSLPCSDIDRQYYIPMGYMVTADFTWTFDQCIYVAELRSADTVHPTFRVHAQSLGRWIEKVAPSAKLYVDYSEDKWSFKRGKQDIVEKK
jgi:thymidylate synthase ThyX